MKIVLKIVYYLWYDYYLECCIGWCKEGFSCFKGLFIILGNSCYLKF